MITRVLKFGFEEQIKKSKILRAKISLFLSLSCQRFLELHCCSIVPSGPNCHDLNLQVWWEKGCHNRQAQSILALTMNSPPPRLLILNRDTITDFYWIMNAPHVWQHILNMFFVDHWSRDQRDDGYSKVTTTIWAAQLTPNCSTKPTERR